MTPRIFDNCSNADSESALRRPSRYSSGSPAYLRIWAMNDATAEMAGVTTRGTRPRGCCQLVAYLPQRVCPLSHVRFPLQRRPWEALAVGLTDNPAADVEGYIRAAGLPVATPLIVGPVGEPGSASVPSAAWAAG